MPYMVTNPGGKHWCAEIQIFDTYEQAERRAREVSINSAQNHEIWELTATTILDVSATVQRRAPVGV